MGDHRTHHQHYYYNQQARGARKFERDFDFEKANEDFLESVDGVIKNISQIDLEHCDSQLSPNGLFFVSIFHFQVLCDKLIFIS